MSSHRGLIALLALALGARTAYGVRALPPSSTSSQTPPRNGPPPKSILKLSSILKGQKDHSSESLHSAISSPTLLAPNSTSMSNKNSSASLYFSASSQAFGTPASSKRVRFDLGSSTCPDESPCGPHGTDPKRRPSWLEFMHRSAGIGFGRPRKKVETSKLCILDKPYLHYTGSRYCCRADQPKVTDCCDVLAIVYSGVQQARLEPQDEMLFWGFSSWTGLLLGKNQTSKEELDMFKEEQEVIWAEMAKKEVESIVRQARPVKWREWNQLSEDEKKNVFMEIEWERTMQRKTNTYSKLVLEHAEDLNKFKAHWKGVCPRGTFDVEDEQSLLKMLSRFVCNSS